MEGTDNQQQQQRQQPQSTPAAAIDPQQYAAIVQQAAMYPQYANQILGQAAGQITPPQLAANQQVLTAMAMNAAAVAAAAQAQPAADEPLYVNAKQYHRILKRREARAKLEAKNNGKRDKGYIHESRHRHAMRRPRGPGGRFLSASELAALKEREGSAQSNVSGSATPESSSSARNGIELTPTITHSPHTVQITQAAMQQLAHLSPGQQQAVIQLHRQQHQLKQQQQRQAAQLAQLAQQQKQQQPATQQQNGSVAASSRPA